MGRHGRRWHRGLDRRSRERVRVLVYLVMLHMQKWPELRIFPGCKGNASPSEQGWQLCHISLWPGARDLRPEVGPAASRPGHALLTQLPNEVTAEKEARAGLPVSKKQALHSMTPL